jgi:hypothetical protein
MAFLVPLGKSGQERLQTKRGENVSRFRPERQLKRAQLTAQKAQNSQAVQ